MKFLTRRTLKTIPTLAGVSGLVAALLANLAATPCARAQSSGQRTPKAAFEVASIKPALEPEREVVICFVPCTPGERLTTTGSLVDIRYMSLNELLVRAYRVKPYQVSGPAWIRDKRFDIMATMPVGMSADRIPEMLQSLLAERFKLTIHRETKELAVYALVAGKNGIKLQAAAAGTGDQRLAGPSARRVFTSDGEGHMENGRITISSSRFGPMRSLDGGKWELRAVTMSAMAEFLTPNSDRPVIDETKLSGAYRFVFGTDDLQEGSGNTQADRSASDSFSTSLMQSLEKGGLKFERRKASIETIMIDHIEQAPTAN